MTAGGEKKNILGQIAEYDQHNSPLQPDTSDTNQMPDENKKNDTNHHVFISGDEAKGDSDNVDIKEEARLVFEILTDLAAENNQGNNEQVDKETVSKSDIRHFFPQQQNRVDVIPKKKTELIELYENVEKDMREKAKKTNSLNDTVKNLTAAGTFWKRRDNNNNERGWKRTRHILRLYKRHIPGQS